MTATTTRDRPTWPDLPAGVRAGIEARLGATVTGWTSHDGGYSQGLASTLRTDRGPVFVKAVPTEHELTARLYRQEAERSALLGEGVPAPRLRWLTEIGLAQGPEWVVLAFDAIEGRVPAQPWRDDELRAVLDLAVEVGEHEVEVGVLPDFASELPVDRAGRLADERPAGLASFDPWLAEHLDRLSTIERDAASAVAGDRLVHGDLRGDNAVIVAGGPSRARGHGPGDHGPGCGGPGRGGAVAVDWAYPGRGAGFCDLVGMLPAVQVEGGPPPEEALRRRPLPTGTDEDAVTAYLVALAGYFVHASLQPPPPGIPHVRAFQRAQGEVCVAWLRRRLA
ncbi:aminoglycoside phosphotransferase family protein [Isoptericola sp. NEAU-Y5]|uniref:Aminoglycoside phosphotransferase family protein n=1 Tax=Isoptericola luteus TaxID=2879484 RepID=A0ABS7ZE86_9MICO|nr:phosphotransferase [Isoptericola sp. NEAU-Y5]MCA5893351.1 aminoglycoside phosphotransferase family protein [Isoptericola sp. NEAU-Y5]